MSNFIFPSFYLPPISYFYYIKKSNKTLNIEIYENFVKQSYRTRSIIGTANGPLNLIIPIKHTDKAKTPMKDVRISYDSNWQRLHWMSITSAYRRTPYFEFYETELYDFYHKKETFLIDYNTKILKVLLRFLKINIPITFTDEYKENIPSQVDLRKELHPKKEFKTPVLPPYYHIFEEKTSFISNLSIIDLLFHQGPYSDDYF